MTIFKTSVSFPSKIFVDRTFFQAPEFNVYDPPLQDMKASTAKKSSNKKMEEIIRNLKSL